MQFHVINIRACILPNKMPQSCCAVLCNHTHQTCLLKRFPTDSNRSKIWEDNINRQGWKRGPNDRLCECHFDENQWERNREVPKLKPNAIPTKYLTHGCERRLKKSNFQKVTRVRGDSIGRSLKLTPPPNPNRSVEGRNQQRNKRRKHTQEGSCTFIKRGKTFGSLHMKIDNQPNKQEDLHVHQINSDPCNTSSTHIKKLQQTVWRLEKELSNAKSKLRTIERKLENIFNADQIEYLSKGNVEKWSKQSMKKALDIRFACGVSGYNFLTAQGWPLPSYRSLCRRTKKMPTDPGASEFTVQLRQAKNRLYRSTFCNPSTPEECQINESARLLKDHLYATVNLPKISLKYHANQNKQDNKGK